MQARGYNLIVGAGAAPVDIRTQKLIGGSNGGTALAYGWRTLDGKTRRFFQPPRLGVEKPPLIVKQCR